MNRRVKSIIIVAGLTMLALHFFILFVYSFRPGKYSFYYAYPFFQQSWALFIPPPQDNYKLFVSYNDKGEQRVDLFTEILSGHQSNRFNGTEPLIIALSNSIYYFEKEQEPDVHGTNFRIVEKFVINYLNKTRKLHLDSARIFILVNNAGTGQSRLYHN